MSYNLFLDDVRFPADVATFMTKKVLHPQIYNDLEWEIVRNYQEFRLIIKELGLPNFVSFDHDLAEEHYMNRPDQVEYTEPTGHDCAAYLIDYCMDNNLKFPEYAIHSFNPGGAENIKSLIENFKKYQNEPSH